MTRIIALLCLLASMPGCVALPIGATQTAPTNRRVRPLQNDASRCTRLSAGADSPYRIHLAGRASDSAVLARLAEVPDAVRLTLRAGGLEDAVALLLESDAADPEHVGIEYFARRQAVALHLATLEAQLRATLFEIDCVDDHLEAALSSLDERSNGRETRITLASLALASVGGIVASSIELVGRGDRGAHITALTAGAVGGTLGFAALGPSGLGVFGRARHGVYMPHRHNLLTPIVEGEDPEHVHPTFLFRLLTMRGEDGRSVREDLVQRFDAALSTELGDDANRARAEALLYGSGGVYDRRHLALRETLLDETELATSAFARNLEIVQRWLTARFDDMRTQPSRETMD